MDNYDLLQKASDLAESGQMDRARSLVLKAIQNDKRDVEAWWALAHVANSDSERKYAIDQVLKLEPNHMHALHMRDQIKAGSIGHIKKGGRIHDKASTSYVSQDVDYSTKAVVTLILYLVLPFIGIATNLFFLYEARKFRRTNGYAARNVGCLYQLFGFFVLFPLAIAFLFLFLAIVVG